MHLIAINEPSTAFDHRVIDQMHQLRASVFGDRLGWNVDCSSGREQDQFDDLGPTYILALSESENVIGCARLLPATGTTMLQSIFPQLLRDGVLPSSPTMIESSRFCVDTNAISDREQGAIHPATLAMFAAIIEWSILNGYRDIVTATDVRLERLLRRAGWPLSRLGQPAQINETRSVAGILPADWQSFDLLRPSAYSSNFATLETGVA